MLPTKEELDILVNKNIGFYKKDLRGFQNYNYRNIHGKQFFDIAKETGINVFESRGILFGKDPIDESDVVFPSIHKFFNANEVEQTSFDVLTSKKVIYMSKKRDGSLISFIPIELDMLDDNNLRFIAKTKNSFENDQCIMSQYLYDNNHNIKMFVRSCYYNKIFPLFELVGRSNPIVVAENRDRLVLIAIRDKDGNYVENIKENVFVKKYKIECDVHFNIDLNIIKKFQKEKTNIEGWVVLFDDNTMVKFKTDWYIKAHRDKFSTLVRENDIIHLILDEKIDDAMSVITDKDKIDEIYSISEKVNRYYCKHLSLINKYLQEFKDTERFPTRKHFYDYVLSYEYAPIVMLGVSLKNIETDTRLKESIKRKTLKLERAKAFLKEVELEAIT